MTSKVALTVHTDMPHNLQEWLARNIEQFTSELTVLDLVNLKPIDIVNLIMKSNGLVQSDNLTDHDPCYYATESLSTALQAVQQVNQLSRELRAATIFSCQAKKMHVVQIYESSPGASYIV